MDEWTRWRLNARYDAINRFNGQGRKKIYFRGRLVSITKSNWILSISRSYPPFGRGLVESADKLRFPGRIFTFFSSLILFFWLQRTWFSALARCTRHDFVFTDFDRVWVYYLLFL